MAEWTQERHKAAKARCDVATGQPWVVWGTPEHNYVDSNTEETCSSCGREGWHGSLGVDFDKVEDAAFCAGARTDLPDALTEIERLRERLRDAQDSLDIEGALEEGERDIWL